MWILKVWSQLSGKTHGNFPGLSTTLFFLCGHLAHRPEAPPLFSPSSPLFCFPTPLFCSFLSFYLYPLLCFGQPLIPGQFKRPHPGSPMEQGCSVHSLSGSRLPSQGPRRHFTGAAF